MGRVTGLETAVQTIWKCKETNAENLQQYRNKAVCRSRESTGSGFVKEICYMKVECKLRGVCVSAKWCVSPPLCHCRLCGCWCHPRCGRKRARPHRPCTVSWQPSGATWRSSTPDLFPGCRQGNASHPVMCLGRSGQMWPLPAQQYWTSPEWCDALGAGGGNGTSGYDNAKYSRL